MTLPIFKPPPEAARHGVQALRFDYAAGAMEPLHVHPDEGLLIHAESGAYQLFTEDCCWALLPGRAVWLPPGWPSGLRAGRRGPVNLRPLHFPEPLPADLPAAPKVVLVGPLMLAVIREIRTQPPPDEALLAALRHVALHEIRRAAPTPLMSLPQPRHAGLRRVAAEQLADLSAQWPLAACAAAAHLSERSFCRLFPQEAGGMGWPAWVRQARMMVARQLLEAGQPVSQAALQLGYDSPSAFAAAYRRVHGQAPRQDTARGSAAEP